MTGGLAVLALLPGANVARNREETIEIKIFLVIGQ
jgi:hypothetical protein